MAPVSPLSGIDTLHVPLFHHALYSADVSGVMQTLIGPLSAESVTAVGGTFEVYNSSEGLKARLCEGALAWVHMSEATGSKPGRPMCTRIGALPMALRRSAGAAYFTVFGDGEPLEEFGAAAISLCRATGMDYGRYHIAAFPGGALIFDAELDQPPAEAGPIALRAWCDARLRSHMALVRDKGSNLRASVRFLVGVDRLVKTLLPGYLNAGTSFDAALEGLRFLPSRRALPKTGSVAISAA